MTATAARTFRIFSIIAGLALAACSAVPVKEARLVTDSYLIPSQDPGIQLYIRNKRPEGMSRFSAERTLLYVHGATQASETTFDLPLDGTSWMEFVAQRGWDVWLVDLRGYGRSTRPPEMDQPAANNPPVVTTDVAVRDVTAAIEHILARRGVPKINLMAWSWGCTIMATYTTKNNDKVNRLVLYAPQWLKNPQPAASANPLGAYQTWTTDAARKLLQNGAPEQKLKELFPDTWYDAWSAAALATDPLGSKQSPAVVRTPNGIVQDSRDYWNVGKPYYDPSGITAPTLIAHAEWDAVTPGYMAQAVFARLTGAPHRRLVEIGEGTHFIFLEKNCMQLFREVQLFLDERLP